MDMSCVLGLWLGGKSQPTDIICLSYGSMDVELDGGDMDLVWQIIMAGCLQIGQNVIAFDAHDTRESN